MNPSAIFKEFFRREGIYYLIGLTMLIAIDVAFLIVPQFIGSAIDTLSQNKEGLTQYILYFIGLLIIINLFCSRCHTNLLVCGETLHRL